MIRILLLFGALLGPFSAFARNDVGLTFTGARHYTGIALAGDFDLDAKKQWTGNLSYGNVSSDIEGKSNTNEITAGATYEPEESNQYNPGLTYWTDSSNKISFAGPFFGYTHNWMGGEGDDVTEMFGLSIDTGLDFYSAEVPGGAALASRGRRGGDKVKTASFHPNIEIEKPLWDELVTPSASYTHYFYSVDPIQLEELLNRLGTRFSAFDFTNVNSLIGGFLRNSWDVGLSVAPFHRTNFGFAFGRQQSATDNSWSTTYGLNATRVFAEHYKVRLAWNHAIQDEKPIDFISVGLAYLF